MQSWLKGSIWVGKSAQATGMTASLRILSSKADSNNWEVHSQHSHLPGNFRALHASFCWQALWRCWFHFPAGLGTCPHCQRYQKLVQWPWCYCAWLASKLTRPEPQRIYDERHQTQQRRWPEGCYQSNLGFITPEQCHRLIDSMPRRIDAVIHAKGGPTKYWVHRNEHTFQKPDISV